MDENSVKTRMLVSNANSSSLSVSRFSPEERLCTKHAAMMTRNRGARVVQEAIEMKPINITLPELMLVAGTRAALGVGVGLLISSRYPRETRKAVGKTLV